MKHYILTIEPKGQRTLLIGVYTDITTAGGKLDETPSSADLESLGKELQVLLYEWDDEVSKCTRKWTKSPIPEKIYPPICNEVLGIAYWAVKECSL